MTRTQRQLVATALCATCVLVAALLDSREFFVAYLPAFLFCLGLSLGSMANLMLHEITGGQWGLTLRRPWTAAMRLVPLNAVLFAPLLFALPRLYPWIHSTESIVHAKAWWLNLPFFLARAALYFLIWSLLAWRWLSIAARSTTARPLALRRLSAIGLIVYGLTISLAAVDWIMSLLPQWYSTAFGLLIGTSQMLAGMALAVLARSYVHAPDLPPGAFNDFGNLLLMYAMTWAYLAFTQFLIIWAEDLPHEIAWYVPRVQTSWRWLTLAIVVLEFALPFLLLLSRAIKRTPAALAGLAATLLVGQLLFSFHLVSPTLEPDGLTVSWTDVLTLIGVVGLWSIAWLRRFAERPMTRSA
ncbi:MAG TPA: hypothetical protein VH814_17460 [Steroidobacteraceae bacterium]|jgi:hypothetical protein